MRLIYKPGNQNIIPDLLTRRSDYDLGGGDNQEMILLPDHIFSIRHINRSNSDQKFDNLIKEAQQADETTLTALHMASAKSDWTITDGIT